VARQAEKQEQALRSELERLQSELSRATEESDGARVQVRVSNAQSSLMFRLK
jgi:hypothetical protein